VVLHDDALPAPLRTIDLVGFPLRGRSMDAAERRRTAAEMLEQAGLAGLGQMPVSALTLLQSRLAAVARAVMRALLFTTPLLLLDEPLAGLEPDARTALVRGLRGLQAQCGLTILAAMRDPLAARAFADRIAVFESGQIAQVGPPGEVWTTPSTLACARATGETNLLQGTIESQGLGAAEVRLQDGIVLPARLPTAIGGGMPCLLHVRPEHLLLNAKPGLPATVAELRDEGGQLRVTLQADEHVLVARLPPGPCAPPGSVVSLGWQRAHAAAFPLP
jgi:ABC-type Fe3+/spermidine/putrescine transport system ATPase subunit